MRDPWQVLGVARTATDDEIKSAYKKLSMLHHPDRPGGNEELFKEISTAYNDIKDLESRRAYINAQPFRGHAQNSNPYTHNFGHDFGRSPFADVNINMNDIFSGFKQRPQQRPTNRDININYTCSVEESHTGANKLVEVKIPNGESRFVEIEIPRGVDNGHKIRYPGLGDTRYPQLPNGDLYVTIKIQPHEKWNKSRNNLTMYLDIHAIDAILGTEQVIETIDGKSLAMRIPAGTQPNTKMRVPECGTYSLDMTRKGDLIVEIKVKTPQMTEQELIDYIKRSK